MTNTSLALPGEIDLAPPSPRQYAQVMTGFREFSSSEEGGPIVRNIDSDAPLGMRHELIDLIFYLAEHYPYQHSPDRLQKVICQSIGIPASGQPYGGYRYAAGRDLGKASWVRVYDVICRVRQEFRNGDVAQEYSEGVNRILAGYGVVWELTGEGRLQRHLPGPAQAVVTAAITELSDPRYTAALALMNAARDAFDDRPRRDRDACSNVFDSLESAGKELFNMPTATFGSVLAQVRQAAALQPEVVSILEAVNTLRNRKFGHGMTTPFSLSAGEVDFTYLTCIGGILAFIRK
jgi:hypothetical protein